MNADKREYPEFLSRYGLPICRDDDPDFVKENIERFAFRDWKTANEVRAFISRFVSEIPDGGEVASSAGVFTFRDVGVQLREQRVFVFFGCYFTGFGGRTYFCAANTTREIYEEVSIFADGMPPRVPPGMRHVADSTLGCDGVASVFADVWFLGKTPRFLLVPFGVNSDWRLF